MKPHKVKVGKTTQQKPTKAPGNEGYVFTVQSVYYSSRDPESHIHFMDADKDNFMFPVPGQNDGKVLHLQSPVSIKLPVHYLDETEGNMFVLFGELNKPGY